MWIKVLATGYFAQQDTKTPVKIGIVAMVANMVFNVIFVYWLYDQGIGHAGLALATAASAWMNASLLWWGLKKRGVWQPSTIKSKFIAPVLASVAMALTLWFGLERAAVDWMSASFADRVANLAILVVLGLVVYLSVVPMLGWRKATLIAPK